MEKPSKNWEAKTVCREFGMGLTTFKRLFNHVYGTSPRTWICERRIIYAHQLLVTAENEYCRYFYGSQDSLANLTLHKSYHRRFNMTPSKVRHLKLKIIKIRPIIIISSSFNSSLEYAKFVLMSENYCDKATN